jgi:hypothetical protein
MTSNITTGINIWNIVMTFAGAIVVIIGRWNTSCREFIIPIIYEREPENKMFVTRELMTAPFIKSLVAATELIIVLTRLVFFICFFIFLLRVR